MPFLAQLIGSCIDFGNSKERRMCEMVNMYGKLNKKMGRCREIIHAAPRDAVCRVCVSSYDPVEFHDGPGDVKNPI